MSPDAHHRWRELRLWAGVLTGPLVWLMLLEANYVMSYVACEQRQTWFLHAATAVSLLVVALAGAAAWTAGASSGDIKSGPAAVIGRAESESRAIWMSRAGVATSAWFAIVILAMDLPVLIVPPCVGR